MRRTKGAYLRYASAGGTLRVKHLAYAWLQVFSAPKHCPCLVEPMLALHKSLASAKSPHEKERLERQIKSTDGGIDKLVYELYGLSDDEIKIVES